ncbi:transposase [Streptomyces phyllanthi]|uniref:transposase n=1 Tax=Streptomyces phyllanthi TaxID=1803180 RepID=UPI002AD2C3CB|nr:transposase [Streptomyces phyllanthi]
MSADLSQRLVPDGLWELVAPLLPSFNSRPQGGGTAPLDERAVFTAVVYVLTSGCAWRYLPETFGVSPATAHRRFTAWTEVGLWRRLHRAVLDELGAQGEIDYRRLTVRYERKGSHFLAFLGLAAALTCYKKLAKLTM